MKHERRYTEVRTLNTKASFKQIRAMLKRLIQLCLDLFVNTRGKFPELQNEQVQRVIVMDEKSLIQRFTDFINAGCRVGLLGIIDLNTETTWNFRNYVSVDKSVGGPTGLHKFADLKVKAVNKLREGEKSITGTEFLSRLHEDNEVLVHTNFLEYVMNNIHDEDVKEFLKKNSIEITNLYGKTLFAFGDVFQEPGDWPRHVWAIRQYKASWESSVNYISDSCFDKNCCALVFE